MSRGIYEFQGEIRFQYEFRSLSEHYSGMPAKKVTVNGWGNPDPSDNGRQLNPLMFLRFKARPNNRFLFHIDLRFNHPMLKSGNDFIRVLDFRNLNGRAQYKAHYGTFELQVNRVRFTTSRVISGWDGYKFSPFYRLPWDWYRTPKYKYGQYFLEDPISDIDPNYTNNGGIRGIGIRGTNLPNGFGFTVGIGKNPQTGGSNIGDVQDVNIFAPSKLTFFRTTQ